MASAHRDAPNPYRPYYIPPSIGPPPGAVPSPSQAASSASRPSFGTSARDILSDLPVDYSEYLDKSEALGFTGAAKRLLDQAIWNYTSVLLAQPFEVARIVLQVRDAGFGQDKEVKKEGNRRASKKRHTGSGHGRAHEEFYDSGSDDDDVRSYFSSMAPDMRSTSQRLASRHSNRYSAKTPPGSRSRSLTPTPPSSASQARHDSKASALTSQPEYRLDLKAHSNSLLEVLSQLWGKEAAWGWWRGTNCSFVYNVLLKTIESWMRSLLAALLNLPEPTIASLPGNGGFGLDILDSPDPLGSLGVAVLASGIAALLLAPLDLTRTRLILTPTSSQPRAILPSLRSLPTLFAPPNMIPIVTLHSCVPTAISTFTPLVLRTSLGLDPVVTPAAYGIATFLSQLVELFAKLPLETILRRGQINILQGWRQHEAYTTFLSHPPSPHHSQIQSPYSSMSHSQLQPLSPLSPVKIPERSDALPTIVPVGPYRGVFGTAWHIVREEGTRPAPMVQRMAASAQHMDIPSYRKGQGLQGLWRGWRVGFWGLVGVWSAAALSPGPSGGEF